MVNVKDHTGNKFGRLLAVSKNRTDEVTFYRCVCDCGEETEIASSHLISGSTRSCGCLLREESRKRATRHGLYRSRTYTSWAQMLSRCSNEKTREWHRYGGRGITVCERWLKFKNFLEDMGPRPPGKTLDRENNDEGYCKDNCKWSNLKEQASNRHNNVFVKLHGERMTQSDAAKTIGVRRGTLHRWMAAGKLPQGLELTT